MCRVLFCDWENTPEDANTSKLLELTDLSDYNVVFFDPLQFAINAGLRTNRDDLHKGEYFSYSEDELKTFLAGTKLASEILRDFVIAGGIFVIRSNLPKSYIKVTKESIVGIISNKYTESIVSVFYWLEEFLGKFSCDYGVEYSFSYIAPRSRIYKTFGQSSAKSVCSIILNRCTHQYVIAESASEPHNPLIYTVSGKLGMGETYVIPTFLVKEEATQLAKLFSEIHKNKTGGIDYPFWVDRYEQKLNKINPFNRQVVDIDNEIEHLKQKRSYLYQQSEEIRELLQLLHGSKADLAYAVKKAFEILGFQFPSIPETIKSAGFDIYMRCGQAANLVADIYDSDKWAISTDEYDITVEKLKKCNRDDKPKVIIVANAVKTVIPTKREVEFADETIEANRHRGFCLLSSTKLFDLACSVLENDFSPHIEAMKEAIQSDIIKCTGEYEANIRKYLAITTV